MIIKCFLDPLFQLNAISMKKVYLRDIFKVGSIDYVAPDFIVF